LYTTRPERAGYFNTFPRRRFFISDRELWVACRWNLPNPGEHVSHVVLRPPAETATKQSQYRFRAESQSWITFQRFALPSADEARALAGEWRIEVALDDSPVGMRTFQFEAASIRLRTDAILFITEGMGDPESAGGGYRWTGESRVLQATKDAALRAGQVLRDELLRRFPRVVGPAALQDASGATLVIHPILRFPPNLSIPSRLEMEVSRPATGEKRKFIFRSTVGIERVADLGTMYFSLAATDLAFQAASNPEVLDYFVQATGATPQE
jgi:hypothetical protein